MINVNQFLVNSHFLYPLKTENQRYRKGFQRTSIILLLFLLRENRDFGGMSDFLQPWGDDKKMGGDFCRGGCVIMS